MLHLDVFVLLKLWKAIFHQKRYNHQKSGSFWNWLILNVIASILYTSVYLRRSSDLGGGASFTQVCDQAFNSVCYFGTRGCHGWCSGCHLDNITLILRILLWLTVVILCFIHWWMLIIMYWYTKQAPSNEGKSCISICLIDWPTDMCFQYMPDQ